MAYVKFFLVCVGYVAVVTILNNFIGALTGFKLGWLVMAAITGWIPGRVLKGIDRKIEQDRQKEEIALKEYHKKEEAQRNTEEAKREEFEKLPAWKRVELMKQQAAEKKEQ